MDKKKEIAIGGQAVIEGVMMRGPEHIATAVRRANDSIDIDRQPFVSKATSGKFLGLPIIRGFVSLIEMMIIGFRSLSFSAKRWELDQEDIKKKSKTRERFEDTMSYAIAFVLAIALFFFLPLRLADFIVPGGMAYENIWVNLSAGVLRIVFFVLYVWGISLMKDVRRLFAYHGAEHSAVHAWENGASLSPESVLGFSTKHPRCGTSFIFLVLLVSILVFSVADTALMLWLDIEINAYVRLYHLLLVPLVSGLSYEVLKAAGRKRNNILLRILSAPGMWLQSITTQKPDEAQCEVAILALRAALDLPLEHDNINFIED
ncbi:MAG: DUF1385 domain-containing protein [Candidatus Cloacimonetes bacterium]|nr:DUF1385 domain-containing protein [Candidatus Cloacimonadota bacterium]